MQRRDFMKSLAAVSMGARALLGQNGAAAAQHPGTPPPAAAMTREPGPLPWMRGLLEVKPLPLGAVVPDMVASAEEQFFSDEQMATLRKLCAILLPPLKGKPGAIDAGAPEFLDFLISVSPQERQELYTAGLDRLNYEAKGQFGVGFADVDASQADALLRPRLRAWMADHPPEDPYEAFVNLAHADIRTATESSAAWDRAAAAAGQRAPGVGLYWYPVEPDVEEKYLPRS